MTKNHLMLLCALCLLAGCMSGKNKTESIMGEDQISKALANAKPPQQFGFSVYSTGDGVAMRGTARLHPMHMATAKFIGMSPVIKMEGSGSGMAMNALIDPSSADTWIEYTTAMDFRTSFLGLDSRTISYSGNTYLGGANAYAAVIPQLRIKQLLIEYAPVYVRMARNSLGPLARGIEDPKVNAVIGYDTLRNFEFVQFDLEKETIVFSSSRSYEPTEALLIGSAGIVETPGAGLVVQGGINGTATPILLDLAGQFNFALSGATMNITPMVELGEVVYVNAPTIAASTSDGLPRVGAGLLRKYIVTICPRAGIVYFERPGR